MFEDILKDIYDDNDTTPETENKPQNHGDTQAMTQETESGNASQTEQVKSLVRTYSHYSFAEACRTAHAIPYLIAGHVQEKGLHMTYGEPASGKTFLVVDKACSIACDEITSWHGKSLKHGQVIYLA